MSLWNMLGLTTTDAQDDASKKFAFNQGAGQINTQQSDQDRANQSSLVQALQQQMAGKGPSLAQGQLTQATDANMKQAMALGAAQQGQGLGSSSALMNIGRATSDAQQQAAGQSSMQRNLEQMQAQQQLSGLLGGMRGQDAGIASQQAQNNMGMQGMQSQDALAHQQLASGIDTQMQQNRMQAMTGLASAGAQGLSGLASMGGKAAMAWTGGQIGAGGHLDSPKNDTVPAMLSPGEIVLPRSVAMDGDAPGKAAAFVEAIRKAKGYADGGSVADLEPLVQPDPSLWQRAKDVVVPAAQSAAKSMVLGPFGAIDSARQGIDSALGAGAQMTGAAPLTVGGILERGMAGPPEAPRASVGAPQEPKSAAKPLAPTGAPSDLRAPGVSSYRPELALEKAAGDKEGAAAQSMANAQGQSAAAQADVAKANIDAAQTLQANHEKQQAELGAAINKRETDLSTTIDQMASMKADPHRFWATRSTGDKILAGIGMALGSIGGMGAGPGHGVNAAVGVIDNAIKQDMAAQESDKETAKAGVGAKQTMLGMMQRKFGDNATAHAAALAAHWQTASNMLDEAKLRNSSPQFQAQAQQAQALIGQKYAEAAMRAKQLTNTETQSAFMNSVNARHLNAETNVLNAKSAAAGAPAAPSAGLAAAQRLNQTWGEASGRTGNITKHIPDTDAAEFDDRADASALSIATHLNGGKTPKPAMMEYVRKNMIPHAGDTEKQGRLKLSVLNQAMQKPGAATFEFSEGADGE